MQKEFLPVLKVFIEKMKNKNQQNTLSLFNKKPNDIVCMLC